MGTTTFNKIMLPKKWPCQNFLSDILGFIRSSSTYKNSQSMLHFWSSLWSTCPSKISPAQQLLQGVPVLQESVLSKALQSWKLFALLRWLPRISIDKALRGGPFLDSLTISILREDTLAQGTSHGKGWKKSCRRVETKLRDLNGKQR